MLWFVKSRRAQSKDDYETWLGGGVVPTLNAFENANDTRATVIIFDTGSHGDGIRMSDETVATATVRRLTPTECERLQGFPDGWTAERIDEVWGLDTQADSARYKQMGNAVAVPCVEWIVNRLVAYEQVR